MKKYILSIDAGTTGITLLLFNKKLNIEYKDYNELEQYYPNPGWVEHDPIELINKINNMIDELLNKFNSSSIDSIGITNQRETVVIWDKYTGVPIYNAIVWQCTRTKDYCDNLKDQYNKDIFNKTGLYIDSYFSASKIKWILDNTPHEEKNILFGTIDTWIIWNLTNRKVHATDFTNASRTMIFNINKIKWDKSLLKIFNIPKTILPKVQKSMDDFGVIHNTQNPIPIKGVSGDQQAALFGQGCVNKGSSKCTYGTGIFYLLNTGKIRSDSKHGLLTTLASDVNGNPIYAIEGSVFIGGAIMQWLRDELKIIMNVDETHDIAVNIENTNGVYIVPAFSGLGPPYWDTECKGTITGLNRGSKKDHIIRAALESIAYQVNDLLNCIVKDLNKPIIKLNVDGGATKNSFLLQFQSDISNIEIIKPENIESTAVGAALLAGLSNKFWKNINEVQNIKIIDRVYKPLMNNKKREDLLNGWKKAIHKTRS